MLNLINFFVNIFLNIRVSFENKRKGSEAHLGKLAAQNTNHQYDQMLLDTTAVHAALFGEVLDIETKIGLQKTQTKIVDKIILNFTKRCSRLNAYFISTELIKDPLYSTFFPQGIMEYTENTNKGNAEAHIGVLVSAITNHTTEAGGINVLHEFQAFNTDYEAARVLQNQKIGGTKGARIDRKVAEVAWANQLFSNLLDLSKEFMNKPEMMSAFFTQEYFQPDRSSTSEHVGTLTGLITRGHTDNVPEPDVQVHVVDGKINDVYSKADGTYRTQHLKDGFYRVQFIKAGFITREIKVEIKNDEDTICDVAMEMSE